MTDTERKALCLLLRMEAIRQNGTSDIGYLLRDLERRIDREEAAEAVAAAR